MKDDSLELDKYVAKLAKKGKKRYFIEKELIQDGYSEAQIERALSYAANQKKEYGKKLLYGGIGLLVVSIVSVIVLKRGNYLILTSFLSACFMVYDGYIKIKNFLK